ncbi:DUF2079 domain-containing protein [Streptococcus loxodontisalivarius]|uniref:DUF2079 domain-containing protein n=1 Tax=Streptococcus loxodontisalivarius TaxID=1349415 RepID=A0ABS2PPJ0_9STRE|nr:DUF2079 domain-containing protein [Streptococcus loxodontisalivarius]MBM7641956.1 hypothetical protein [Streptococcus loxodontisalivarius]
MNDMTSDFSTDTQQTSYSRSQKVTATKPEQTEGKPERPLVKTPKAKGWHRLLIVILSLLVTGLSVAVPAFSDFANSVQSQHLYTGLMFSRGQLPYTDIFATGGFLYYALIALSYHMKSTAWLLIVEFLAFYISGIYLYRIVAYFTNKAQFASGASVIFYLANLSLGFGGMYPIQFAMPFVLIALWFLVKYFAEKTTDEAFILYGFTGALAILFDARTLIFWIVSFLAIIIYNIGQKHFMRGFYQVLCLVFGSILVIYFTGYFVFNLQMTSDYLADTLTYYLTNLPLMRDNIYLSIAFQIALFLCSGLLVGFVMYFKHIRSQATDKLVKTVIFATALIYALYAIFSQSFSTYLLLYLLPFALSLVALGINDDHDLSLTRTSHRRVRPVGLQTKFLTFFVTASFFLPVAAFAYGIGAPLVSYVANLSVNAERSTLADYISKENSTSGTIYVWDSSAKIYIQSKSQSASKFVLPVNDTANSSNYSDLQDQLIQDSASYIIVNNAQSLPSSVKDNLKNNYETVSVDNVSHFTVYQKK